MRIYLFLIIIFISCSSPETKVKGSMEFPEINLTEGNNCSYSGELNIKSAIAFASDAEAESALKTVMKHTGLPSNFSIVAADVDNAAAVIYKNQRYILYNQRFMEEVKKRTGNKYGSLSILAHEIGHHLSGHTLLDAKARPQLELEADRFSGFIMGKMGASIDDACRAIEIYGGDVASVTHPARRTRLAAIVNGWKDASEKEKVNEISPIPTNPVGKMVYTINIVGGHDYITIRNRSLSKEEFRLSASGTLLGNELNKQTVITNLYNGTPIEILSHVNRTYYVKANTPSGEVYGYIVKSFGGYPTIVEAKVKN